MTGQDETGFDQTGLDTIGLHRTQQDTTRRDCTGQDTKGTVLDAVITFFCDVMYGQKGDDTGRCTVKLWCCVLLNTNSVAD